MKYMVILTIKMKPSVITLGQPLWKRFPAADCADPLIPRPRRGEPLHHGGDVCGIVVVGLTVLFAILLLL